MTAAAAPLEHNVLHGLLPDAAAQATLPDWEETARLALGVFRLGLARADACGAAVALVEELSAVSPDFQRLWAEQEVRTHGAGLKRIDHPELGRLTLEYSAFAVDGAEGLWMMVFTPSTPGAARAIDALLSRRDQAA